MRNNYDLQQIFMKMKLNKEVKISFIGDSLTFGWVDSDPAPAETHSSRLLKVFRDDGSYYEGKQYYSGNMVNTFINDYKNKYNFDKLNCYNRGIPGSSTQDVLNDLMSTTRGEDLYFIMLGANDWNESNYTGDNYWYYYSRLKQICEHFLDSTGAVILIEPPKKVGGTNFSRYNNEYRGFTKSVADELNIPVIRFPDDLLNADDYYDYTHLYPSGYQKMSAHVLDEFAKLQN